MAAKTSVDQRSTIYLHVYRIFRVFENYNQNMLLKIPLRSVTLFVKFR